MTMKLADASRTMSSPEMAVLLSAAELVRNEMSSSCSDQVKRAVTILSLAADEITFGLEQDNSAEDQEYWKSKLHAMFLYKTLLDLHSIEASGEQATEHSPNDNAAQGVCSTAPINDDVADETGCHILCNAQETRNFEACHRLPCMSLSLYFALVKECKWHTEFTQMLCEVSGCTRISLLHGCLNNSCHDSGDINNYILMMHTTSYLLLNSMYNNEIRSACELCLNEYLAVVHEWLTNADSDFIGQCQSCDNFNTQNAKLMICSMLLWLYLHQCDPTPDLIELLESGFQIQKPPDVNFDFLYKIGGTKGSSSGDMETILSALSSNSTSAVKTLINSENAQHISSHITLKVLFQVMYTLSLDIERLTPSINESCNDVSIPNFSGMINCKNIISNFFSIVSADMDNYASQRNKSDMEIVIGENVGKVKQLLAALDYYIRASPEVSLRTGELAETSVDLTSERALETISMRLPGYEDVLSLLLSTVDSCIWESPRLIETLVKNSDLFCRKDHIQKLLDVVCLLFLRGDKIKADLIHLCSASFSSLPPLLQEQIICEQYALYGSALAEADSVLYSSKLTSVFNRMVEQEIQQILPEVAVLLLMDPARTLIHAVEVAVTTKGQCHLIGKILQSFPSICRYMHPEKHPDSSLLCHSLCKFCLGGNMSSTEETQFKEFICHLVEDYEHCLYASHNASEYPVLGPEECIRIIILPCINVDNLFSQSCGIPASLATEIFQTILSNCLAKHLPISWMNSLQPMAVVLCLCEMLHETIMLESVAKICSRDVRASILTLVKDIIPLISSDEHCDEGLFWLLAQLDNLDATVYLYVCRLLDSCSKTLHCLTPKFTESLHGVTESKLPTMTVLRLAVQDVTMATEKVTLNSSLSYPDVILCLSMLLPNLQSYDWISIGCFLRRLMETQHFRVHYRPDFIVSLPFLDLRSVQHEMWLLQSYSDAMLLMTRGDHIHETSPVLLHAIQCYVKVVSLLCPSTPGDHDRTTVDLMQADVFLLSQAMYHACVVGQCTGTLACDQIGVLILQLLNVYEQLTHSLSKFGVKVTGEDQIPSVIMKGLDLMHSTEHIQTARKKLGTI